MVLKDAGWGYTALCEAWSWEKLRAGEARVGGGGDGGAGRGGASCGEGGLGGGGCGEGDTRTVTGDGGDGGDEVTGPRSFSEAPPPVGSSAGVDPRARRMVRSFLFVIAIIHL